MPTGIKVQPWNRLKAEGFEAYQLFVEYLALGAQRSAFNIAKESGRTLQLIQQLIERFDWLARAKAYDDHLIYVQQRAIERTLQDDAIKWAVRRSEYREKEFTLGEKLMQRAEEMLAVPIYEEVVQEQYPDGTAKTIVKKPARWSMRDIPAIIDCSAKLHRLSMEMETSRDHHTFNLNGDPTERLAKARGVLAKLMADVQQLMVQHPALTQEQIIETYYLQVATDWEVPIEQLKSVEIDLLTEPVPLTETKLLSENN